MTVGTLVILGSFLLSLVTWNAWPWLGLAAFVLMGAVYAVKAVRFLLARRSA
ncbi:hypothetical protein [Streptomyces sp. NPDC055055]